MSASSVDEKHSAHSSVLPEVALPYDAEVAKSEVDPGKVLRKLDLRLLPFVSLLYLLSFLYVKLCTSASVRLLIQLSKRRDRSNIGEEEELSV